MLTINVLLDFIFESDWLIRNIEKELGKTFKKNVIHNVAIMSS